MKNLLILLIITTLFSCNNSDEKEMEFQYNLITGMEFSIFNSAGDDLLNPENQNHLNVRNIKLFYIIDGEKQEIYYPIRIYKHENEYRIIVIPNRNRYKENDKSITYIQWDENDIDTLEVTFKETQRSFIQQEIWLNGTSIWKLGLIEPYFVLIK